MSTDRNLVGWFEIYVQDMERAKAFYQKTFEVTLQRLENIDLEIWAFPVNMESVGAGGALVKMEGKSSGGGGTIIYFSCADCAVQADRAAKSGGEIQRAKFSIGPYGFISYIIDTEGNLIGLHSLK